MGYWLFLKRAILGAVVLVVFSAAPGCIPVEDLGGYWDKGGLDPELEGQWRQLGKDFRSQDEYASFVKSGTVYQHKHISVETLHWDDMPETVWSTRCISWRDQRFMLGPLPADFKELVKEEDYLGKKGGVLQLYSIEENVLTLSFLKHAVLNAAVRGGHIEGVIKPDDLAGPTLRRLDERTLRYLAHLARNPKNLERVVRYERVQDLQRALKESLAYPATADTLANAEVNIHIPDFKYFAEGRTDVLLRHLQASPEWRVCKERDGFVAYRRMKQEGQWQDGSNGFHADLVNDETFHQIRYLFRFSERPYGLYARWAKANHVMAVDPLVGKTHVRLHLSDQGITSYVAIGMKGLWFEFHEQTKKEPRQYTRDAIKWLQAFLSEVRNAAEEVKVCGYASTLMPANTVRSGQPVLQVEDGIQPGIYAVRAWVNPQQEGYVYVKVFHAQTGEALSAEAIALRSREYTGFSREENRLFFYSCEVTVYEGDWDHSYEARFEVWFQPEDSGLERKLVETTRQVFGWQR